MPVRIRIGGESDIEAAAQRHQPGHSVAGGAVHSDAAIPVGGHEAERGIDDIIHDSGIQAVALDDRLAEPGGGAPKRIDPDPDAGRSDDIHVDDLGKILDIRGGEVVSMDMRGFERDGERHPLDVFQASFQQRVRDPFDSHSDIKLSRATIGRVVLEAAEFRRIV